VKLDVTRSGDDIKKIIDELPKRIEAVGAHLGRTIALRALAEVQKRLPGGSGWPTVYRNAISAFESADAKEFVVAGYANVAEPAEPSEISLLDFAAVDPALDPVASAIAAVMIPYNPWVIDAIPPIEGGYIGDAVVRQTSATAVEAERSRLHGLLPVVGAALKASGAKLLTSGSKVYITGKFYTDTVWLAKRLEIGAGGFPKKPHWKPAGNITSKSGESWGNGQGTKVEAIIRGGDSTKLPEATAAQLSAFAEKRAEANL
jgi:hypothetical protein